MEESRRVRVRIEGHVQGVFFRATVRDAARRLGLSGWVRNVPGGSVEAELQGPPDAVAHGLEVCATGPPAARVTRVVTEDLEPAPGGGGFVVR